MEHKDSKVCPKGIGNKILATKAMPQVQMVLVGSNMEDSSLEVREDGGALTNSNIEIETS